MQWGGAGKMCNVCNRARVAIPRRMRYLGPSEASEQRIHRSSVEPAVPARYRARARPRRSSTRVCTTLFIPTQSAAQAMPTSRVASLRSARHVHWLRRGCSELSVPRGTTHAPVRVDIGAAIVPPSSSHHQALHEPCQPFALRRSEAHRMFVPTPCISGLSKR